MYYGSVYGMFCKQENDKPYIGQGKNWQRRVDDHFKEAKRGFKGRFFDTIRKWPDPKYWDCIELQRCRTYDLCLKAERKWIKFFKANKPDHGYNYTKGGNGWGTKDLNKTAQKKSRSMKKLFENGYISPMSGKFHTKETRKKIKEKALKRLKDPEERKKISEGNKKRYKDPKARKQTSISGKRGWEKRSRKSEDSPMYGRRKIDGKWYTKEQVAEMRS